MNDKNGVKLTVGAKVRFCASSDFSDEVLTGWVRAIRNDGMCARVDDGEQHDMTGQSASIARYLRSDELEVA